MPSHVEFYRDLPRHYLTDTLLQWLHIHAEPPPSIQVRPTIPPKTTLNFGLEGGFHAPLAPVPSDSRRGRLKHCAALRTPRRKTTVGSVMNRKRGPEALAPMAPMAPLCGAAAFLIAVGLGAAGHDGPLTSTMSASSSAVPSLPSPGGVPGGDGGGALPVEPVGGGGCVAGLNCGCIPNVTCPRPHPRHGLADGHQTTAPAPHNP